MSQGVSKTDPNTLVCVSVRTGANEISPEASAGTRKSPSYAGISMGAPTGTSIVNSAPRTVTVPVAPPDIARSRLGMVGTSSRATALVAGDGPSVTVACTLPPGSTTAGDRSTVISCGPVASPCPAGRTQCTVGVTVPATATGSAGGDGAAVAPTQPSDSTKQAASRPVTPGLRRRIT